MFGYIYKTTNLITNKVYIGQHATKKVKETGLKDPKYFGSGKHEKSALKKYGKENFTCEIIDVADSLEELNEKEIYWIAYYKDLLEDDCYNIAEGGSGGNNLKYKSEEEILEIHDKIRDSINKYYTTEEFRQTRAELLAKPEYHKHLSDGIKAARDNPNSGYHTAECTAKKSKAIKALWDDPNSVYNSTEYRKKQSEGIKKAKANMSKEQKQMWAKKIGECTAERWKNPDYKHHMKLLKAKCIIIYNETTDEKILFESVGDCQKELHIDVRHLIKTGGYIKTKQYKGWRIAYYDSTKEGGD